jgi:hypothetical protein
MVFRLNNMAADWESEPQEEEPEEEIKQMIQEVKDKIGSLKASADELTAMVENDFINDVKADGPKR